MTQSHATLWHTKDELRFDKALKKRLEETRDLGKNKILNYITTQLLKITHNQEINLKEVLSPDLFDLLKDCKCYITGVNTDDGEISLDAYYKLDMFNNILIGLGSQSPIWSKLAINYENHSYSLFSFFDLAYQDKGKAVPNFEIDFTTGKLFELETLSDREHNGISFDFTVKNY